MKIQKSGDKGNNLMNELGKLGLPFLALPVSRHPQDIMTQAAGTHLHPLQTHTTHAPQTC